MLLNPLENADGREALIASQQRLSGTALRQVGAETEINGRSTRLGEALIGSVGNKMIAWTEPRGDNPQPSPPFTPDAQGRVIDLDRDDMIYAIGWDGTLRQYIPYSSSPVGEFFVGEAHSLSVSEKGDIIVTGGYGGLTAVSKTQRHDEKRDEFRIVGRRSLPPSNYADDDGIHQLQVFADGAAVAVSQGSEVYIFDLPQLTPRKTITNAHPSGLAAGPGAELFVATRDAVIQFDADSGLTRTVSNDGWSAITVDHSGRLLARSKDTLSVYDPPTYQEPTRYTLPGEAGVQELGPGMIATYGDRGLIRFEWKTEGLGLSTHVGGEVREGRFAPDGAQIALFSDDGRVRLYEDGRETFTSPMRTQRTGFGFLPSGEFAFTSSAGDELVIISRTKEEIFRTSIPRGTAWLFNDSQVLALQTSDGIELLDARSGARQSFIPIKTPHPILNMELIPSQNQLTASLPNVTTAVWDIQTGALAHELNHVGRATAGKGLLTVSGRFYDTDTWEESDTRIPAEIMAAHPDEDLFFFTQRGESTGTQPPTEVVLWDRSAGRPIGRIGGYDLIESLQISGDGLQLMIASTLEIDAAGGNSAQPAEIIRGLWDPSTGCERVRDSVRMEQVKAVGPKGWEPKCGYSANSVPTADPSSESTLAPNTQVATPTTTPSSGSTPTQSVPTASGWVAVLDSKPKAESGSFASATEMAANLTAGSGTPVEVLDTDAYRTLTPGYWAVVLTGSTTEAEARAACARVGREPGSTCYPRSLG